MKIVGKSIRRVDGLAKVTGQARYPQDFYPEGMLYAKALRSRYSHALIKKINVSRARELEGVRAVLTAQDVPGRNLFGHMIADQPVLCQDKVRFRGDAVAVVAAESEEIAQEALSFIQVDYDPLPVVSDPRQALKPDAPRVHEKGNILTHYKIRKGDVEKAFQEAHLVIESNYRTPCVEHAYLQPESGIAYVEDTGDLVIIVATQCVYIDRHQIARSLGLPEEKVKVVLAETGGAFGGREDISVQILIGLLALKTGRPVKMTYSREESILSTAKRHPAYMRYKSGVDREGRLLAWEAEIIADTGAYASSGAAVVQNMAMYAPGPYKVDNVKIDAYAVYTNNTFAGAMRAFGCPQVTFASEMQMNKLAAALGMDEYEFRRRNAMVGKSEFATGYLADVDNCQIVCLDEVVRLSNWKEKRYRQNKEAGKDRFYGIGIAAGFKNVGYGSGYVDSSSAEVELMPGKVRLKISAVDQGQGVETILCQIAAEELAISMENVEYTNPDTSVTPNAGSSSASRQTFNSGNAVRLACLDLKKNLQQLLDSRKWKRPPGYPGHTSYNWSNILQEFLSMEGETEGMASVIGRATYVPPPTTPLDPETGEGIPAYSFGFGAQVAEVVVDKRTGQVDLKKVYAAHDVGRAINPLQVEGQIEGGVVMGQGYALMEEIILKEGETLTPDLATFDIPTSLDVCDIESAILEVPDRHGPYGARGVGEMTTISTAPAIAAAVHDAVGVWIDELPVTAEKVVRALKEKEFQGKDVREETLPEKTLQEKDFQDQALREDKGIAHAPRRTTSHENWVIFKGDLNV
ncbi:nicotinate dehydrogenase large molybdopterin subunit [Candidatus Hakubella thermalkaliphila]|uniref:Nicotinate dehydrogenase large molybdopterin subunit n=1 Tax=Candidatus Hakubella thermalkaliphila TaxID=2754717 RepID=A0A6V8PHG1_9ACTN|nr:nicotinate dehydrogenase large molybdopterin subunit [Candidatus Hakubella thermalkaliphila]